MRPALRRVLTVGKRIIFLAVLIAVGEGDFDVLAFQVNDWVENFARKILVQQIVEAARGFELWERKCGPATASARYMAGG